MKKLFFLLALILIMSKNTLKAENNQPTDPGTIYGLCVDIVTGIKKGTIQSFKLGNSGIKLVWHNKQLIVIAGTATGATYIAYDLYNNPEHIPEVFNLVQEHSKNQICTFLSWIQQNATVLVLPFTNWLLDNICQLQA